MSDFFNAFEMSPVPAPAEDARPPEPFRGIYGMPMFVTVPTRDLEGSAEFWAEAFGFFTLFDIPGKLVHLRRWAFQDVLLVPAGDESAPADGNAAPAASATSSTPEIAGIPRVAVSFSCVLSQIETIAETCDRLIPGCVRGPRSTLWNSLEVEVTTPENVRVIFTAAKPLDPNGEQADNMERIGIRVPRTSQE